MNDLTLTASDIVVSAVYIRVPNQNVTSTYSGPAVVNEAMFGNIFTTYLPISKFLASSTTVSSQVIRYPGGSVGEDAVAKYSLRFADVYAEPEPGDASYNAYTQKGLTDVLAAAVATHSDFSMVIPTKRYMTDVATGVEDLTFFLRRLLHGDFGKLPDHVMLELGNETSWIGWVNGVFTSGEGSYGYIANAFLEVIKTVLASPVDNPRGLDIDVAVQIGTTTARGQSAIFNQITPENLRTVDAFVRHSALLDNVADPIDLTLDGYDFQYEQQKLGDVMAYWSRAWNGNPPEMVLFDSAWSVGGGESIDEVGNVDYDHLGVGQGASVVRLFSALIAAGGDIAAAWGATAAASSLFGVKGTELSYGGQAFRLMSESLVGTNLVSGNIVNGQWVSTNTFMDVITYQDDSKVVTFVSGSEAPTDGAAVTIDLSAFGHFSYAWAEVIRVPDTVPGDHNVDFMFTAYVERYPVPILFGPDGDSIHITLTHDHEVVRIILAKEDPGYGSLYLYGAETPDSLYGALGGDSLYGNGGNDRIDARTGADSIYGGDGNDTVFSGDGDDSVLGGMGNDSVLGGRGADRILGEAGADQISAGDGSDLIVGGDGNDTLIGGTTEFDGADTILGGTGSDWLDGGVGMDELQGEADNDTVYGQAGNDRLFLGDGSDLGYGGLGDDTINAGRDADQIYGGTGADQINAGDGSDLVFGEEGNDLMIGGTQSTDLRDSIYGGDGADTIDGGYGHDLLFGDADNDSIFGNVGNDMVYGGPGADTLSGGPGTDSLDGGDGNDYISGDDGHDRIDGGFGADLLNGNAGNDTLTGNLNDDAEYGGTGNDVLSGGSGNDLLSGDDGDDFLYGGLGNDTLTGGTGGDYFFHSGNAVDGTDLVTDYNAAEGDLLMFGDATAGPEDFLVEFRTVPDSGVGETYETLIVYAPSGTILWSLVDSESSEQLNLQLDSQVYDLLGGGSN